VSVEPRTVFLVNMSGLHGHQRYCISYALAWLLTRCWPCRKDENNACGQPRVMASSASTCISLIPTCYLSRTCCLASLTPYCGQSPNQQLTPLAHLASTTRNHLRHRPITHSLHSLTSHLRHATTFVVWQATDGAGTCGGVAGIFLASECVGGTFSLLHSRR
jgi:hypothetical protein